MVDIEILSMLSKDYYDQYMTKCQNQKQVHKAQTARLSEHHLQLHYNTAYINQLMQLVQPQCRYCTELSTSFVKLNYDLW